MSVGIGWSPIGLTVTLSPGVKFKPAGFQLRDSAGVDMNWPVGTTARLVLTNVTPGFSATWSGVISGANLSFDQTIVNVALVPDGAHAALYLKYGTQDEILWLSGGVVWRS